MKTGEKPLKLIVMHGWGSTLAETAAALRDLLGLECHWKDGAFYVPRRPALMLRRLLGETRQERYFQALRKLIFARFLRSSLGSITLNSTILNRDFARFTEAHLAAQFPEWGLPFSPAARARRACALQAEAETDLQPILTLLPEIAATGAHGLPTEETVRMLIMERAVPHASPAEILKLFETVRDMQETGGDLDSVASAALYTHWLRSAATAQGRTLQYGRDYRYVFLNYHESLLVFEKLAPAELYMADLPIGAFPEFETEIRALARHGIVVARFEDHHPYSPEQAAMLARLVQEKLVGFYALSGPLLGQEVEGHELKCGADMVYENTILGQPWNCAGALELRRAAHAEDFALRDNELGRILTTLIKSGTNKVQLAQFLDDSIPRHNILEAVHSRYHSVLSAAPLQLDSRSRELLDENVFKLRFARPRLSRSACTTPARRRKRRRRNRRTQRFSLRTGRAGTAARARPTSHICQHGCSLLHYRPPRRGLLVLLLWRNSACGSAPESGRPLGQLEHPYDHSRRCRGRWTRRCRCLPPRG